MKRKTSKRQVLNKALRAAFSTGWLLLVAPPCSSAIAAQDKIATRDDLFRRTLKHPQDIALAIAYARSCVELHDEEGAIGALERILFYKPDDANLKAQLGFLYAQLHSEQIAKQYFHGALANPALDADTRRKIAALESSGTDSLGGHVSAFAQAGVRYQTNAAFNPDNNILRLSNQDFVFLHPQDRKSDANGFETLQLGYDYDLGDQHGDTIEARLTSYATQQIHLTDLNVGYYDVTIGPRFAIAPEALPGWSIKPYVAGGQFFLAGSRYLASEGAGVVADIPITSRLSLAPGAEVRRLDFKNVSVFSSLNSGDAVTVSLSGQAALTDIFAATARVYASRDHADAAYQSSFDVAEEFALLARFPAPFNLPTLWSTSPYVKLHQIRFDAANPFIDANTKRHDNELEVGVVVDTPLSGAVDLITNVNFAKVASNIPNYRLNNFSVLMGPAVRF